MNILEEEQISLSRLASERGVNVSTIWRWCHRGARGVRLESFALGGKRFTTREAFGRFVEASSAAAGISLPAPSAKQFERDAVAAERELKTMGL